MSTPDPDGPRKPFFREMTVAHIREREGPEYVQVLFLESARFYKLPKGHPSFEEILVQLRDAMTKRRVVQVGLASPDGDVIEDVHMA